MSPNLQYFPTVISLFAHTKSIILITCMLGIKEGMKKNNLQFVIILQLFDD